MFKSSNTQKSTNQQHNGFLVHNILIGKKFKLLNISNVSETVEP